MTRTESRMTQTDSLSRPNTARGGFTLIEVVISLVILTVGLLAVASLSMTTIWQTHRADDLTNSALAAQKVLDDVSVLPFDSVVVGAYVDTIEFGLADYIVNWTVEDMTDSLSDGSGEIKRIYVLSGGGLTQTTAAPFELFIYQAGNL